MRRAFISTAFKLPTMLASGLLLQACISLRSSPASEFPLVPLEHVASAGGVIPWRAPLRIQDNQLQLTEYTAAGQRQLQTYDEVTFPVDVLIVTSEPDEEAVSVFLRRSPHGGCLLLWDHEAGLIHDPCFGSKFDRSGRIISGPAQRSLDELPASVRDGMVWVGSVVIYGEPSTSP